MDKMLKSIYQKAKEAGACREALNYMEQCETLEEVIQHPSAPHWALWYALNVIRGRWPEAEPVIVRNIQAARFYAEYIGINERWTVGEATILSCPRWSARYAANVLHSRWPEAESIIKTDAYAAYLYARFVLKGRWPEAEETIKMDALSAYFYAKFILHAQWPEAEQTIKSDPILAASYAAFILKRRWPEAEPAIAADFVANKFYCEHFHELE